MVSDMVNSKEGYPTRNWQERVFDPSYAIKRRFQRVMTANDESLKEQQNDKQEDKVQDDIFSTEEIVIEEMAIDGICGVY
jgi:mycofactocin precursor